MIEYRVKGIPDLVATLRAIPDKLRKRALQNALSAGARVVRDAARRTTPTLSKASALRNKLRTPGLVRQSISVRSSKQAKRAGDVGVFVNVRPAKAADRGAKSKRDPYYWRWIEFGWNPTSNATGGAKGKAGVRYRRKLNNSGSPKVRTGWRFLQTGARRLDDALQVFLRKITPAIQRLDKRQEP